MPRLKIRVGKCTNIGNFRENNEDRMFVGEEQQLFLVADGMGGQAAGEQASQIAVDVIPERLASLLPANTTENAEVRRSIKDAVIAANETILAQGIADPSLQNMGTTVVMALLRGATVYIAHVGDSRAYRLPDGKGKFETITIDHNLAQALLEAGTITQDEVKNHRFRHVLWKFLGSKDCVDGPDIDSFDLHAGERILLATDGLCGIVEDEKIASEILRHSDPQKCAESLVKLALDEGSKDNVTVVLLFVDAIE